MSDYDPWPGPANEIENKIKIYVLMFQVKHLIKIVDDILVYSPLIPMKNYNSTSKFAIESKYLPKIDHAGL